MKLNITLTENLAAALKEIDLLKGRLKELEVNFKKKKNLLNFYLENTSSKQ